MSDYTITGAVASNNLTDPLKLSEPSSLDIVVAADVTVTLTIADTIAFPATITAERIGTSADVILWDSIVTDTLTAPPVEFSVTAQTTPVVQLGRLVSQNYLVTITDSDDRTQTLNIAIDSTDGYPTACMGTPSESLPEAPVLAKFLGEDAPVVDPPSDNPLIMSWTTPADGGSPITGYKIEGVLDPDTLPPAVDDPGWGILVADTGTTATTYDVSPSFCDDPQFYRISAINSVGVGPASNQQGFGVVCP